MRKFLPLFILIYFSSSSLSNIPSRSSGIDLKAKYSNYLNNKEQEKYADFEDYIIERFGRYPLDCLKISEEYRAGIHVDGILF
jgi:hypothetical protein